MLARLDTVKGQRIDQYAMRMNALAISIKHMDWAVRKYGLSCEMTMPRSITYLAAPDCPLVAERQAALP